MKTLAVSVFVFCLLALTDIGTAWGVQHVVSSAIESTFGAVNAALVAANGR